MMRLFVFDWEWVVDLSVTVEHEHDFKTGLTRFYRGERDIPAYE